MTITKKKLIEVALPLDAINKASAREKSIRHGHPSTLHLWWARRPLAAARAVIFAQMVDDPSAHPDLFPTAKAQEKERQRLFRIIEDLVQWENSNNARVLQAARDEIWQSWRATCAESVDHPRAKALFDRHKLPPFHDPFAGGGAIPLEAQRLGLNSYATDLNPVAVLINKAMIAVPPKFSGRSPVRPIEGGARNLVNGHGTRAGGLAEDLKFYGQWVRDEAAKRIGHLYPDIEITPAMAKERPDLKPLVGKKLTAIAWIWARTVRSPNPAFSKVEVPLAASFLLGTKPGKEAYIEPVVEEGSYRFRVRVGKPIDPAAAADGTKLARGANFRCIMSGSPMTGEYIKSEGRAGRMGARLMAIVAEGERSRVYVSPTPEHETAALKAVPDWRPETPLAPDPRALWTPPYGLTTYGHLFTDRQLVALNTLSSLVLEARERVLRDALVAGMPEGETLASDGTGAKAYADAVALLLAFAVDRIANYSSTVCSWHSGIKYETVTSTFGRQAIPMTWDFAETNVLAESSGSWANGIDWMARVVSELPACASGTASQLDAMSPTPAVDAPVVSTDPPYYDNIGYADLSDFFYVWQRRTLRSIFPDLFTTLAVPRAEELVAIPYRHGSKEKAEDFFLQGMTTAMHRLAERAHPGFPVTIYYAFKQAETESQGTASTGWETFLDAVVRAGFALSGTWPMRTEYTGNLKKNVGALASSIVLVCRPRSPDAPTVTRRDFAAALKVELPAALAHLQKGNIAPVDLAQSAIGPGMAVFTRYAKVLDAQGQPVTVRDALALINQTLDEALAEQEGDFDADSRWALAWFEQWGFENGEYGVAETLSKAKNTSIKGLEEAGILRSARGKVRLLKASELQADWDPATDTRLTSWEVVHHLIRSLDSGGELAAAALVAKLGAKAELARELAYRLYTLCERKRRPADALAYNSLVQSWPEITRLAREGGNSQPAQGGLFNEEKV